MTGRGGFTLLESLVALLLAALLIQGGWAVLATLVRGGGRVAEISEGLETVRTVAWILEEEVAGGMRSRDWWAGGGDTLSLRAYRGLSLLRERGADGEVTVCYWGVRNPNPEKDSVLFLGAGGRWTPHALLSRARSDPGCLGGDEGWLEVWRVEPEVGEAVLGRVYERGSYHLAGGAFRYRRGMGGRQPLTPERIADGILQEGPGEEGLRWEVLLAGSGTGKEAVLWSGWIR